MKVKRFTGLLLGTLVLCLTSSSLAARPASEVHEKIGQQIPLNLAFQDEAGQEVQLSRYVNGSGPVVLTLVYFNCPLLCNLLLNGFVAGLTQGVGIPAGELDIMTISIDPREKPPLAQAKKKSYLAQLKDVDVVGTWAFLTSASDGARKVAQAVGFDYRYDSDTTEYIHPATIMFLAPDGTVVRYLYGTYFLPDQIRLAWIEAGGGDGLERLKAWFFEYDSEARKYVLALGRVLTVSMILALVVSSPIILWLLGRLRRKSDAS